MSRLEMALGIRYMEIRLVAGEDPKVDRVRHKAVCLEGKLPDEGDHRDRHPYFAYRDRQHVRVRRLVLGRRLV